MSNLKFKFNPSQQYQLDAISAVTDIFSGQSPSKQDFEISFIEPSGWTANEFGIGNRLELIDEEVLENLQKVQLRNGLPKNDRLNGMNFTVEMETGTGKTYVYLRTLFELNKKYGFAKFVIVVPSLAIREGVYKFLEMTKEHFQTLYDNVPYEYFIYSSDKLSEVRNFAVSDKIQIMIINIQAFSKSFVDPHKESKANIIHRSNEKLNGNKPIDLIQASNPIVVIDEPQSVDTTSKSREAISSLNPMCTLRYSATHKDLFNQVYKLDAVDAYERKLVKQIEVASVRAESDFNRPYIKLLEVTNKGGYKARLELDILDKGKVKRAVKTVKTGDDLLDTSGNRELYSGYIVESIDCALGYESIQFSNGELVQLKVALGQENEDDLKRYQIRKTIESHLDKELRLNEMGIKVLSLFFIDKVSNYRQYDKDGRRIKGKYALMFEEEYLDVIKKPKYRNLFNYLHEKEVTMDDVDAAHDGYFSVDSKGRVKDTTGSSQADEDTYSLIMKKKEELLSFNTKLRFIFSHSALREGWDNPNVFQICTLNETNSNIKKRQEVGRGLRLAVNQNGERVFGHEVNRLTVMANESYEDFAKNLQREIEEETGIKFGYIEKHSFANILTESNGENVYLGYAKSEAIWIDLHNNHYINDYGKILDKLHVDIKDGRLELDKEFYDIRLPIISTIKKIAGERKVNILPADKKRTVKLKKEVLRDSDFVELWNRIKHKTTFRVDFDVEKLKEKCIDKIKIMSKIPKPRFIYEKAETAISKGGVTAVATYESSNEYGHYKTQLPDILTYLQNSTNLTRRTLVEILTKSQRLNDFKNNPQRYMDTVSEIINKELSMFIVDGIKYRKLDEEHYAMEIFKCSELTGYLEHNIVESTKGVYDHIIYDSDVEARFAQKMENNETVKLYAKLPKDFVINTPIGGYNPDWAILIEEDGEKKLYFVVETKGTMDEYQLRPTEFAKIQCGIKHFEALNNEIQFEVTDDLSKIL